MVTVAAPTVAVLDAVNVAITELPVVAVDGLKDTVTPLGNPLAVKLTAPVKLLRLMAMVAAADAPRATVVAGPAPRVKSPAALTVSDTVVLRTVLPDVPVMVTVAAPSVAVLEAVNVATTELPVVAVDGLKATVTPLGRPVAAKLTAPVKLVRLMAMVAPADAPRTTDTGDGV